MSMGKKYIITNVNGKNGIAYGLFKIVLNGKPIVLRTHSLNYEGNIEENNKVANFPSAGL